MDMLEDYTEIYKDSLHDHEDVLRQLVIAERRTLDRIF